MNEIKLEALRVRSRIKIYMQDGKNASFFFGKIQTIESEGDEATGHLLLDQPSVSDEYRSYYAKRYQLVDFDPNEAEYFFNFLVIPMDPSPV